MSERKIQPNQRLSQSAKEANGKAWYKEQADRLDVEQSSNNYSNSSGVSDYKRMKVNYDLFNNILDTTDFEYVCQPFGAEQGELPAQMVNRDILSGKIKTLLGQEIKRPFPWEVAAVNPEATTRKEQAEFGLVREFVVDKIMAPIRKQIEIEYQEQQAGRELTPKEKEDLEAQMRAEIQIKTPEEVKKYMKREHQDPAELLSQHLLRYLMQQEQIVRKFNDGFKHGLISAREVYYSGIERGNPVVRNVNPLRFSYDKSPDLTFIEDGEWATNEIRMMPSEVVQFFGEEMSGPEIDKLYESYAYYGEQNIREGMFDFSDNSYDHSSDNNTIRALHVVWKSLRKIGILYYKDENGETQEMVVDETYRYKPERGDIEVSWEWIPEVYETWKINDMYFRMQPFPGQFKDLDNLFHCKLPYYGAIYDNMNSQETSLVDRLKVYQYYYNIVMYRIELLMASDKGKKIAFNINAIPKSMGIDVEKWQYFMESGPFIWFNPNEEGNEFIDVNNFAKEIDLSLASDISKYMDLAEYLKIQAGKSVGITEPVEGQTGPNDAVSNNRQNIVQSSHILEMYFDLHNHVKRNVLQSMIENAKVAYADGKSKKLTYILDDMSKALFELDPDLLDNSTYGIFVTNSSKAEETKEYIRQLSHAALQNQKAELSDILSILSQDDIIQSKETLKVAEDKRREDERSVQESQIQAAAAEAEKNRIHEEKQHGWKLEEIEKKGDEDRKTAVVEGALTAASFNPDQDADNDGINDFIEIARHGLDADIKRDKSRLDRDKFEEEKKQNKRKNALEEKKLKQKPAPKSSN